VTAPWGTPALSSVGTEKVDITRSEKRWSSKKDLRFK